MPIEKKHETKSKAASIGFRNGLMKEEIVSILHEPGLQDLMPEDVKGVLGAELHWAVGYMKKLHDRGRLDTPLPMFETVRSAEVIGLEDQVKNLRDELFWERQAIGEIEILLMEEATKGDDYARELRRKIDILVRKSREKHVKETRG
jgi:hypothetical protein